MHSTLRVILAVLLVVIVSQTVLADVAVIAHPGVADGSLSESQLKAIYRGEKSTWSDGSSITVFALRKTDAGTKAFLETRAGMNLAEYNRFWQQAIFTGAGTPPKEFADDASLVAAVKSTPGAIGYVSDAAAADGVKVIAAP